MSDEPPSKSLDSSESTHPGSFWAELKQRKVVRVGIAYAVIGWAIMEVSDTVLPYLGVAEWLIGLVVVAVILGFPIALVLAWIYERTPEGIQVTDTIRGESSVAAGSPRKQHLWLLVLAALVPTLIFGFLAVHFFFQTQTADSELSALRSPLYSEKSIAVLPLENLNVDGEDSFLADGFHNELTTVLSRVRSIKTISRQSTLRYRNSKKSLQLIAQELGVATLLTGAVQRIGSNVRVNVQLIDAESNNNVWGNTYTKAYIPSEIFAVQGEIGLFIAQELKAALTSEEKEDIARVPTQNLEAMEAYFKGKEIFDNFLLSSTLDAVAHFEKAIELDPDFSLAYIALAELILGESRFEIGDDVYFPGKTEEESKAIHDKLWERVLVLNEMLLELDEGRAEVQVILGGTRRLLKDKEGSKVALERAITLNPNLPNAYKQMAMWNQQYESAKGLRDPNNPEYLAFYEKQFELVEKAVSLDPGNAENRMWLAIGYQAVWRFEDELEQYRLALVSNPEYGLAHRDLGSQLMYRYAKYDEGMLHMRKAHAIEPGFSASNIAFAFRDMGDAEEAIRWLKRFLAVAPGRSARYSIEIVALEGDKEKTREQVEAILAKPKGIQNSFARIWKLNEDLRNGNYEEARTRYFEAEPKLFESNVGELIESRVMSAAMCFWAMELAYILKATGETEQMERLIDASLYLFSKMPKELHHTIAKRHFAMAHILRGDNTAAIQYLQEAVDRGWRNPFEWDEARLDPLRDQLEFIQLAEFVETDMAEQLANVRRMEANGELAAIPELPLSSYK